MYDFLFIYVLFNESRSISQYIVSDGIIMTEQLIWKDTKGSGCDYSNTCLGDCGKPRKYQSDQSVSRTGFERGTSRPQVKSATARTNLLGMYICTCVCVCMYVCTVTCRPISRQRPKYENPTIEKALQKVLSMWSAPCPSLGNGSVNIFQETLSTIGHPLLSNGTMTDNRTVVFRGVRAEQL
jgi:hypothetical protein